MKRMVLVFLIGVVVGALAGTAPVVAQSAQRIFGTFNGAAKAVLVDSSGRVRVTGS